MCTLRRGVGDMEQSSLLLVDFFFCLVLGFFVVSSPTGPTQMGCSCHSASGFTPLQGEEGSGDQVWEVA